MKTYKTTTEDRIAEIAIKYVAPAILAFGAIFTYLVATNNIQIG